VSEVRRGGLRPEPRAWGTVRPREVVATQMDDEDGDDWGTERDASLWNARIIAAINASARRSRAT